MVTPSRNDVLAELRSLESGVQQYMASDTITIASQTYTGAELLARIQVSLDSATSVQEARGALTDAIAKDRLVRKREASFLQDLRLVIGLRFSNSTETLQAFAIQPKKKRKPPSVQESLAAAAKLRATRAERRTMGKRQKAAIKGNVTGVKITPVTSDGTSNGGGKTGD
jgi:hypothetical protein